MRKVRKIIKFSGNSIKTILAILHASLVVILMSGPAFARETLHWEADPNIVGIKAAPTHAAEQASASDPSVDYFISVSKPVGVRPWESGFDNVPVTSRHKITASNLNTNQSETIYSDNPSLPAEKSLQTINPRFRQTTKDKSYIIPALEIPIFLFLLNMCDRLAYPDEEVDGKKSYNTSLSTIENNFSDWSWVIDHDKFAINQFAHPYQGTMHQGFARSAGLNYWEALLYSSAGSFLWEIGGETTRPSINDQIATGIGGSFFGEALFRMAGLVLESNGEKPGFWREMGAAVISPATGFNRFAFGDRFKSVFPDRHQDTFWHARLGVSLNSNISDSGTPTRYETAADFSLAYGLPGKTGHVHTRPFDYFHFEIAGRGNNDAIDSIFVRGLLLGKNYEAGNSLRGIWGLYGGYDYVSPHILPVSSTSVTLGTTFQWWASQAAALQGSVLGGLGYAAAGNIRQDGENEYHYGIAPQGLVALRLIFSERAMLDFTGRAYYITDQGGRENHRTESIDRVNVGCTVRVYDRHALGFQYAASLRNGRYPDRDDARQSAGTVSLFYTWLGNTGFGAVEWRSAESH